MLTGLIVRIDAIAALAALAQETRLDIFRLLVQAGAQGLPAGMIGEKLSLPSATLSFHLNQLKQAHLVKFRRESRSLIYTAEYPVMNALLAYLTENCCQGEIAACRPAAREPATTSTLFAAEPTVTKANYVKWMLDDPCVNFAISTRSGKSGIDHLGMQVETADELQDVYGRLQRADRRSEGPVWSSPERHRTLSGVMK